MAIAPIDLQTLYMQLETVSKTVVSHGQGVQVQNALHNSKQAQINLEKRKTIASAKMPDDEEVIKIKDEQHSNHNSSSNQNAKRNPTEQLELEQDDEQKSNSLINMHLGQHIDLIG